MRREIQDALLSVGEVAAFVWSLLELLLTRILPLAGFLTGHLLLQLGRLLVSVVIPARGRRSRREAAAEYSCDVQAEEVTEGDGVVPQQRGKKDGDHVEGLKGSEESLQDAEDQKVHVAEAPPSDEEVRNPGPPAVLANEVQERGSDDDGNVADTVANEVLPRGDNHGHVAETEPLDVDVGEQGHVSSSGEGIAGKMDSEPSDEQTSPGGGAAGEMRKSRRRIRVLPPSLSQVRRTLMQRSRRASPSPHSKPAIATPSPIKKKPHRKLASSVIKSSPSYDNFMAKFRTHFLLDPAQP